MSSGETGTALGPGECGVHGPFSGPCCRGCTTAIPAQSAVVPVIPLAAYADAVAERDRYRAALERIAGQGLGTYDSGNGVTVTLMGATGAPWKHWATIAEEALDDA